MNKLIKVFRQTFIYGIATVFPRIISVLLVRLHTDKDILENVSDYGSLSIIISYIFVFLVIALIFYYRLKINILRYEFVEIAQLHEINKFLSKSKKTTE